MNALLPMVSPVRRAFVHARAARAVRENDEWARTLLGSAGAPLCRNLAFVIVTITPLLAAEKIRSRLRFCLWTFLLDDRLDDPAASDAQIDAVAESVVTVLDGASSPGGDVLLGTLSELLADLRDRDPSGSVLGQVVDGLRDGVSAGRTHSLLSREVGRGAAPPPSSEEYLALASRSINYRGAALALLLLVGGEFHWDGQRDRLDAALERASRAIRLANDLRSFERHTREGLLNVLGLRTPDGCEVTRGFVLAEIEACVADHDRLVSELPGAHARASRVALLNSLRYSLAAYRLAELR